MLEHGKHYKCFNVLIFLILKEKTHFTDALFNGKLLLHLSSNSFAFSKLSNPFIHKYWQYFHIF